jgi:hypothetical protein
MVLETDLQHSVDYPGKGSTNMVLDTIGFSIHPEVGRLRKKACPPDRCVIFARRDYFFLPDFSGQICLSVSATKMVFDTFAFSAHRLRED